MHRIVKKILFSCLVIGHHTVSSQPAIFCIEGNTGSGKTTLLEALCKKNPHFILVKEPVDEIQNHAGENLLQRCYEDLSRWSFTCNLAFLVYHIKELQKMISRYPNKIYITDRSIFGLMHAFIPLDHDIGCIKNSELLLYKQLFDLMVAQFGKPAGFIYVRTNPDVTYQRINNRARIEELSVPLKYWEQLHAKYEVMFIHKKSEIEYLKDVPLLIIDGNRDVKQSAHHMDSAIKEMETFIFSILNS
jgi:deoxyadenosine/deoxycytidine kinase